MTSLQQRLVKTGGRLVQHARYNWLLLSHLTSEASLWDGLEAGQRTRALGKGSEWVRSAEVW